MRTIIPYFIAVLGITLDWLTTYIGLGRGFYETHLSYTPLLALLIFIGVLVFMEVTLRGFKYKKQYQSLIASMSFLGSVNNTLVLLGVFGELIL